MIEGFSINFEIPGTMKNKGEALVICKQVTSLQFSDTPQIKQVRIKTVTSNVNWGIQSLHVQKNPTSVEFDVYSLDENEPKFWVAGDNSCASKLDGLPCCESEGCDLSLFVGKSHFKQEKLIT